MDQLRRSLPFIEFKIELPGGDRPRKVSIVVREGDSNLNELEIVHVEPHDLIVVILLINKMRSQEITFVISEGK